MRAHRDDARMAQERKSRADGGHRPASRAGRVRANGWSIVDVRSAPLGPGMTAATLEEALAAFQRLDPDLAWPSISELVIPLFQRMRPYASGFPEAVRALVPPGVSVTFAIDAGPAFAHISEDLLGRWGLPLSDVIAQA